jgi:hypothetical protein
MGGDTVPEVFRNACGEEMEVPTISKVIEPQG